MKRIAVLLLLLFGASIAWGSLGEYGDGTSPSDTVYMQFCTWDSSGHGANADTVCWIRFFHGGKIDSVLSTDATYLLGGRPGVYVLPKRAFDETNYGQYTVSFWFNYTDKDQRVYQSNSYIVRDGDVENAPQNIENIKSKSDSSSYTVGGLIRSTPQSDVGVQGASILAIAASCSTHNKAMHSNRSTAILGDPMTLQSDSLYNLILTITTYLDDSLGNAKNKMLLAYAIIEALADDSLGDAKNKILSYLDAAISSRFANTDSLGNALHTLLTNLDVVLSTRYANTDSLGNALYLIWSYLDAAVSSRYANTDSLGNALNLIAQYVNATISSRSSHSAADVWTAGSRSLSTPADYKADVTNLDVAVSSRFTQTGGDSVKGYTDDIPGDVWGADTGGVAAGKYGCQINDFADYKGSGTGATAQEVWEYNISAFSGAGYAGTYLKNLWDKKPAGNFLSDGVWTDAKAGYVDEAISGIDDNPWNNAKSDTASGMGDWLADWFKADYWLTATGFATHSAEDVADAVWGENDTTVVDTSKIGEWLSTNVGGGSCPTVEEISDQVWGENDTSIVDTSQMGKWLVANIGKEATATVDTEAIARYNWAYSSRTLTSFGSGAFACSVYTKLAADSSTLAGIHVIAMNTMQDVTLNHGYTDANGLVVFPLDSITGDGFHKFWLIDIGYNFTFPESADVNKDTALTFYGSAFDYGAPPPDSQCAVYGQVFNPLLDSLNGVIVSAKLYIANDSMITYKGYPISPFTVSDTTDATGRWRLDLIPNAMMLPAGTKYVVNFRYPVTWGGLFAKQDIYVVTVPKQESITWGDLIGR